MASNEQPSVSRRDVVTGTSVAGAMVLLSPAEAKASAFGDFLSQAWETLSAKTATAPARPAFISGIPSVAAADATASCEMPAEDLSNIVNLADFYLSETQLDYLRRFGFFVMLDMGGDEFFEQYESNRYGLLPNFVTVDSMMHTYHLYFSYLLRNLERGRFSSILHDLSARMLEASSSQLEQARESVWESAARRNTAFFAVANSLLNPAADTPADVADIVADELWLIGESAGISPSPLMGGDEDYSQYIVRGYYADDPMLQSYFKAMMWYGRHAFLQNDEELDRSALLMTLAIDGTTMELWQSIYLPTSFFAGASDDLTFFEYLPLVTDVYGEGATLADVLENDSGWKRFHLLTAQTPVPTINALPVEDEGSEADHVAQSKGLRFMGQRFSIDEALMQQLVYNRVLENPEGQLRMLPDVLDVAAAFGSQVALDLLAQQGDTSYAGYPEAMERIRQGLDEASDTLWSASLYSLWLATLRPLLSTKTSGYPAFMQTDAWARKNLQTFAGSYAELKHDTVLYAKQLMAEAGGGGIDPRDDRGYVEPEPEVFGRLAILVDATTVGLATLGLLDDADAANLEILGELASKLQAIATKELRSELPNDEEFELIRSYGAQIEHFWETVHRPEATDGFLTTREFPSAIVTDIATDPNGSVLEIATGRIATLYAAVPVDGSLRLASGAVYSFYQFAQPIDQRLTDTTWRQMMGIELGADGTYSFDESPVDVVSWVQDFSIDPKDLW